jgi:hypothetical protein
MVHPKSGEPGLASDQFRVAILPALKVEGRSGVTSPWSRKGCDWGQLCNPLQPGRSDLGLGAAKRLQVLRLMEGNRALACSMLSSAHCATPTRTGQQNPWP